MSIKLPSSSLIELAGADAVAFAHAQFSSDVAALADGRWQWSAWLSAQGRVRSCFALLRFTANRLVLVLRGDDAEHTCAALRRFVLRAKVELRVVGDVDLSGVLDADRANDADEIEQSGDASLIHLPGSRAIAIGLASDDASESSRIRWRLADIQDGIVELPHALEDAALPQWLGLDRLGAVSVRKGCYPGQEIMSRLHFKGGNKRSLYRIAIDGTDPAMPGAPISDGAGHVGQIVMSERDGEVCEALAILSNDAENAPLTLDTPTPRPIRNVHRFA